MSDVPEGQHRVYYGGWSSFEDMCGWFGVEPRTLDRSWFQYVAFYSVPRALGPDLEIVTIVGYRPYDTRNLHYIHLIETMPRRSNLSIEMYRSVRITFEALRDAGRQKLWPGSFRAGTDIEKGWYAAMDRIATRMGQQTWREMLLAYKQKTESGGS